MKKRFTRILAAVALLVGLTIPLGVWGQEVTLDFTTNDCWDLPTDYTVETGSYTCNGYTIKLTGSSNNGYKFGGSYLINGKNGATLELPAFSFDVDKIVVTGRSGASGSVKQNIFVGTTAVSTETTGATGTNTYNIADDYQAAGNVYVLKVTSAHNTQVTKIEIFKKVASTVATPTFNPANGTTFGDEGLEVTVTCATENTTIYYTLDGSDPDNESTEYTSAISLTETTTIKAIAYDNNNNTSSVATATYTYVDPNAPGTQNNPYTVAQALAANPATGVYVHGIISTITEVSTQYGNATYKISDDGTTSGEMIVFRGKYLGNVAFTSTDQIQVGDIVTVTGDLTVYNNANQLAQGNYLVSLTHKPVITTDAANNSLAVPDQILGSYDETGFAILKVSGSNLTAGITLTLGDNSPFELSTDLENWLSTVTIPQTDGSITNEEVAIRLKESLTTVQQYNDNITLTSTGADNVVVDLSGSVTNQTYTIEQYSTPATAHGTITFAYEGPLYEGTTVTMTPTPDAGYGFTANSWVFYNTDNLEQVTLTVTDGNKINMPAYNLAVDATFTTLPTYTITAVASPTAGGTIATDGTAWEGKEVTVLVEANDGYAFTGIVVSKTDDASTTIETSGNINDGFTFTMPAYAVTVTATFVVNLDVTYDFSTANNFYTEQGGSTHPETGSGNNVDEFYYSNGDHFTTSGGSCYFSSGYFLFGKKNALVNLPTFTDYNITKITVHTSSGGSQSVEVAIVNGENTVVSAVTWTERNHDYTYTIPAQYQSSALSLKVTSSHNAQFTSITLEREIPSTDPSIDVEDEITIAHDATYGEFPYTIINPTGATLYATSATEWISNVAVDATNNKVTFNTTANTSTTDDRTGTITLTYEGAQNKTVSIIQGKHVVDYATLPFEYDGNGSGDLPTGLTVSGLGTYNASPAMKFDDTGDYLILKLNEAPTSLSYDIKGNNFSGGTFDVLVSANGITYESLTSYTVLGATQSITHINLASTVRYIKWVYSNKSNGNVALGNIHASANYDIYGNLTVAELTIPADKVCTVYSPATLNVTTSLTNSATSNAWEHLIIKDGAQLKTPNTVNGTVEKAITGYSSYTGSGNGGYYLLATPATMDACNETGMWPDAIAEHAGIDFYSFDQNSDDEWRNYKYGNDHFAGPLAMEQGIGYLYANPNDVTLTLQTRGYLAPPTYNYEDHPFIATNENKNVDVTFINGKDFAGYNLIGNPFTCTAYLADGRDFYRMNPDGDAIVLATSNAIDVCEGIFVVSTSGESNVAFTTTAPTPGDGVNNNGKIDLNITQGRGALVDNARIRFSEGNAMPKMVFGNNSRVYFQQGNREMAVVRSAAEADMPVSFKASENGTYTLNIEAENVDMNYLHLIDNMTGADVDLLATPSYSFEARTSDYANRFRLVFSANGTNDNEAEAFAYFNGSSWTVSNVGEATLQVVDITGRMVSNETISGNATVSLNQPAGVYVIRLVNGDNVKTQKVVVR